MDFISLPSVVF